MKKLGIIIVCTFCLLSMACNSDTSSEQTSTETEIANKSKSDALSVAKKEEMKKKNNLNTLSPTKTRIRSKVLDPEEFKAALKKHESNVQIIDVRTASEIAKTGKIEGAINLDIRTTDFKKGIMELTKNHKNDIFMVYCAKGGRSANAAQMLESLSVNVYDLEGGIQNWQKQGMPLVKE